VSWKVYSPSNVDLAPQYAELASFPTWNPALYNPIANPEVMVASDHVLPYFSAFRNPASALYANAFTPTFPGSFTADVSSGRLPRVSGPSAARDGDVLTAAVSRGDGRPMTVKSSYNRLAYVKD
jgi:phospholipase C